MESNKIALVTGAAVRIGRAISRSFAEAGYDLLLHYHSSASAVETLAEELKSHGSHVKTIRADFSRPGQIREMWQRLPEEWTPQVLVNNASVFYDSGLEDSGMQDLELNMQVNFRSAYLLTKLFAEQAADDSNIINILDTRINRYDAQFIDYALSKKLLTEFTRVSARILGPKIRVNGIAPGLILPPPGHTISYLQQKAQKIPLQRAGDVQNITKTLLFLLENNFITGQIIFVDGGEHLL